MKFAGSLRNSIAGLVVLQFALSASPLLPQARASELQDIRNQIKDLDHQIRQDKDDLHTAQKHLGDLNSGQSNDDLGLNNGDCDSVCRPNQGQCSQEIFTAAGVSDSDLAVNQACTLLYQKIHDLSMLRSDCQSAVTSCGTVARELEKKKTKARIAEINSDLKDLEQQKSDLTADEVQAQADCPQCEMLQAMQPRTPTTGEQIIAGIQAITPIALGGIGALEYSKSMNAYSGMWNNYYKTCTTTGTPCGSPALAGMYMGVPSGGFGGLGAYGLGAYGLGGLGYGLGGGLSAGLNIGFGTGMGYPYGYGYGYPSGYGQYGQYGQYGMSIPYYAAMPAYMPSYAMAPSIGLSAGVGLGVLNGGFPSAYGYNPFGYSYAPNASAGAYAYLNAGTGFPYMQGGAYASPYAYYPQTYAPYPLAYNSYASSPYYMNGGGYSPYYLNGGAGFNSGAFAQNQAYQQYEMQMYQEQMQSQMLQAGRAQQSQQDAMLAQQQVLEAESRYQQAAAQSYYSSGYAGGFGYGYGSGGYAYPPYVVPTFPSGGFSGGIGLSAGIGFHL